MCLNDQFKCDSLKRSLRCCKKSVVHYLCGDKEFGRMEKVDKRVLYSVSGLGEEGAGGSGKDDEHVWLMKHND